MRRHFEDDDRRFGACSRLWDRLLRSERRRATAGCPRLPVPASPGRPGSKAALARSSVGTKLVEHAPGPP